MEAADLAMKSLNFRHEGFGIGLAKEGAVDAVDAALRLGDPRDHLANARRFGQKALFAFRQAIDDVVEPRKIRAGARLARDYCGPRLQGFHPLARIGGNQPLDLQLAALWRSIPQGQQEAVQPRERQKALSSQAAGCQR